MQYLVHFKYYSQKRQNDLSLYPSKPFSITVIRVYAPNTNAEETEVDWFYEDLQDFLKLTPKKKKCPFHHRGLESKVGSQELPGVIGKFDLGVHNEVQQRLIPRVLPREHTGHSKHSLPTTQEKTLYMDMTRWSTSKSD